MTAPDRSPQALLHAHLGTWHARNRLWFVPEGPTFDSDTTLVVERAVGDVITLLRYTWAHEGTTHDGVLLVRDTAPDAPPAMVWADSFHTGGTFMSLGPGQRTAQGVSATGSYAAPPGPDWGWRIALEATAPSALTLRMYNITPEGEEALAVEAVYTRST